MVNPIWSPIVTPSSLHIQWIKPRGMKQQSRGSVRIDPPLLPRSSCPEYHSFTVKHLPVRLCGQHHKMSLLSKISKSWSCLLLGFPRKCYANHVLYKDIWLHRVVSLQSGNTIQFYHSVYIHNYSCYVLWPRKPSTKYGSNLWIILFMMEQFVSSCQQATGHTIQVLFGTALLWPMNRSLI